MAPFYGVTITQDKGYSFYAAEAKHMIYFGLLITISAMYFRAHPDQDIEGRAQNSYAGAFWNAITAILQNMVDADLSGAE